MKHGGDAADGAELGPLARQRAHRAAVRQRLVYRQVGGVLALLHPRAVERARAVARRSAPAARALVRGLPGPVREEQQLDPAVRRGLERLLPAGRGAAVSAGLLLPPLELLRLLAETCLLEPRLRDRKQIRRRGVLLALRPPHDRPCRLVREHRLELALRLLRTHDDDSPRRPAANKLVDLVGDRP